MNKESIIEMLEQKIKEDGSPRLQMVREIINIIRCDLKGYSGKTTEVTITSLAEIAVELIKADSHEASK